MYYDKFEARKEPLKKLRFDGIALTIFFGAFSATLWIFSFIVIKLWLFITALILSVITYVTLSSAIEHHKILKQFKKIKLSDTYEIKLYRPKIRLMRHSESIYGRPKTNVYYYGITFLDANKKKYYFFFNFEMINLSKLDIKKIEEKLWRELTLQCYENTSIVKTIENDPYFFRIR